MLELKAILEKKLRVLLLKLSILLLVNWRKQRGNQISLIRKLKCCDGRMKRQSANDKKHIPHNVNSAVAKLG